MARTRAQDYEDKRLAILKQATLLFAEFGYSATSISMISGACGASKALLYHYYEDKEEILFDLLHSHLHRLVHIVEKTSAGECAPKEKLGKIIAVILHNYGEVREKHRVQESSLRYLALQRQEIILNLERRLTAIVSENIAKAIPSIAHSPLLMPVTMSLFGMLNTHYLWFKDGKGLSRVEYGALVTELVIAGGGSAARSLRSEFSPPSQRPARKSRVLEKKA